LTVCVRSSSRRSMSYLCRRSSVRSARR
jgi:hypothetical protein